MNICNPQSCDLAIYSISQGERWILQRGFRDTKTASNEVSWKNKSPVSVPNKPTVVNDIQELGLDIISTVFSNIRISKPTALLPMTLATSNTSGAASSTTDGSQQNKD